MTRLAAYFHSCLYNPDGSPAFDCQGPMMLTAALAFVVWLLAG